VTARDYSGRGAQSDAGFVRVASIAELPEGTLLGVTGASGTGVCLFNDKGRIGAVAELCTHQAFPMSQGTLQPDGTIQCSWHGARFDCATGDVREGPAVDPIRVYETRVRDGEIWVGPAR
jgi:nitrite reductase/ring-hydroxylating ferredoxin subunit